jgi:hypothetical protein
MLMKDGNNWLYDGALIEVGTSTTDTDQHISIDEMQALAQELAKYRELHSSEPEKRVHATSWHAGDSLLSSDASLDYNFNANKKI